MRSLPGIARPRHGFAVDAVEHFLDGLEVAFGRLVDQPPLVSRPSDGELASRSEEPGHGGDTTGPDQIALRDSYAGSTQVGLPDLRTL